MATTSGTKSVSRSYNFKVVMLGNCGVGKSSVVLRYVKDTFKEEPITTFEVSWSLTHFRLQSIGIMLYLHHVKRILFVLPEKSC
jgi:GTPase SAR1 family protein